MDVFGTDHIGEMVQQAQNIKNNKDITRTNYDRF